jgi:hypothetical protein
MEEVENKMPPLNGGWTDPEPTISGPMLTPEQVEELPEPVVMIEVFPEPTMSDPNPNPVEYVPATHTIEHRSFGHGMRVTTITGQNN